MGKPDNGMDMFEKVGMERREFLQKLLAAVVGIPAAGALLAGCDGDGLLDSPNGAGPGPVPAGNLDQEVQDMRDVIAGIIQAIQDLEGTEGIDIAGWLAQLNAQLAVVWPLMVAANQQDLRDNVSAEMQQVLDQLDQFGEELDYSGAAPQFTQQDLQTAWDRAEGLLLARPTSQEPYATEQTWIFFLLLFLVFPLIGNDMAFNYALAASSMDTGNEAASLFSMLHPAGAISCTPCLISALLSGLLAIVMLLFMAMGSHAAMAPSMLFGRDYMIALGLMVALLALFVATGT